MYGCKIQNPSFFFPGVVNLERPLERLPEPDENGNPGPFVKKTKFRKERKKTFHHTDTYSYLLSLALALIHNKLNQIPLQNTHI